MCILHCIFNWSLVTQIILFEFVASRSNQLYDTDTSSKSTKLPTCVTMVTSFQEGSPWTGSAKECFFRGGGSVNTPMVELKEFTHRY